MLAALGRSARILQLLAFAVACFCGQLALRRFLVLHETAWVPAAEEVGEKWPPAVARFASFGNVAAVVDLLWMRVLQSTSLTYVPEGVRSAAFADLDLATDLDPRFFEAYASGAPLIAIVRADIDGALELVHKASRYAAGPLKNESPEFQEREWGERWQLPILEGYLYLFEKGDLPSAAKAFVSADGMKGAPEYVSSLARRLREPGGIYDVALRVLSFMAGKTTDEKLRRRYDEQARSVRVSRFVFDTDRAYRSFLAGRRSGPREWERFVAEVLRSPADPWGGRLSLGADDRIDTTTPREHVLGLP